MLKISYSRVSRYLSCPYAHYLSYVEKLKKKTKSRPLYFGSDFHKLLELREHKTDVKKAFKNIKEQYYDLDSGTQSELGDNYLEDLKTIFSDYMRVYKGEEFPEHTELTFDIPIARINGEYLIFTGIIDELYEGKTLIGEHKTFNRKPDSRTLVMNTQKCLYAKAVECFVGKMPLKVQWDYIKSTPAMEPVWLDKSQKFSEAKNNSITPYSWKRACKKRSVTSKEILDKANNYEGNIPNFFFRLTEDYIPEMVNSVYNDFVYTAKEIARNGEKNKTKHISQGCSWCDFKDICYAELTGGNVNYIKEKDFEQK